MKLLLLYTAVLLPQAILAWDGGPCEGSWAKSSTCVCIDHNQCKNKWKGKPIQGTSGNWPCPSDPDNIWGCDMGAQQCLGFFTRCKWRNKCPGSYTEDPLCPGGYDFICCFSDP